MTDRTATLSHAQARRIALVAQGFRDPRHTVPTMRTFDRTLCAHRRAADRLGQRAAAGALHAAVLADGSLRRRPADAGPRSASPAGSWSTGRTSRRSCRSSSGRTCATGCAPIEERGHEWDGGRRTARSWWTRCSPRSPSAAPAPRATSTTGCPGVKEHWGWNWSETKKVMEYLFAAGRAGGRRPQPAVRAGLRPAGAGGAAPSTSRRPSRRSRRRRSSCCAAARSRTASAPSSDLRDYFRMQPRAGQAGARRPRRERRAAAGADRGLEPAGLPPPRRRAAPQGGRPGAAEPVRPGGVGARAAPSTCSTSTTASRSTCRRPSGCTATTCCRSCSATGSSARVDLKADRRSGTLLVLAALGRARRPRGDRRRARRGAGATSRAGSGSTRVRRATRRGDLAPRLLARGWRCGTVL